MILHDAPILPDFTDEGTDRLPEVGTFTSDDVRTIDRDTTLADAAAAMAASDLGLLVVGTPSKVEGVVSERDIVRAVAAGHDVNTTRVSQIETTTLVWCDRRALVTDAAELMLEHYVRHVLVEENGRLVGVVSARDLLGTIVS